MIKNMRLFIRNRQMGNQRFNEWRRKQRMIEDIAEEWCDNFPKHWEIDELSMREKYKLFMAHYAEYCVMKREVYKILNEAVFYKGLGEEESKALLPAYPK